jgi:hypothetical protein
MRNNIFKQSRQCVLVWAGRLSINKRLGSVYLCYDIFYTARYPKKRSYIAIMNNEYHCFSEDFKCDESTGNGECGAGDVLTESQTANISMNTAASQRINN